MSGTVEKQIESPSILPDSFVSDIISGLSRIEVDRACIFGSAAKKGLSARDIDLLIISPEFAGVKFSSREDIVTLPDSHHFDIRPYTYDEFERFCPRGHPFRENLEDQAIELMGQGAEK